MHMMMRADRHLDGEKGENPFWVSFADLMTSLMVLLLVVLSTILMAATQPLRYMQNREKDRATVIESCMSQLERYTQTIPGVRLIDSTITFGPLAEFDNNSSVLYPKQEEFLRRFIPQILAISRTPACKAFFKQISVEGFASQRGSYLYNLDLSMRRSERVLCALLETQTGSHLSNLERKQVEEVFVVDGYSFNSTQRNEEDSRRITLKLEFYGLSEEQSSSSHGMVRSPFAGVPDSASCPMGER